MKQKLLQQLSFRAQPTPLSPLRRNRVKVSATSPRKPWAVLSHFPPMDRNAQRPLPQGDSGKGIAERMQLARFFEITA